MKKIVFLFLILSVVSLTGCDAFRKIAGRPTSEDIRNRREAIAEAQRADSIRRQEIADSLAMADSVRKASAAIKTSEDGVEYSDSLGSRYYIVLGTFKSEGNVRAMMKAASDAGHMPYVFPYSGLTAVGICPTNTLGEAQDALNALLKEDFCPY
ncbi:MAG: SPOR domain-containing protein, partial [Bacteroidales bacterium]|nr:SPOR domain-containing protein [Bacteroidales bacterium]